MFSSFSNRLYQILSRIVVLERHELRALWWSFAYFFCLLAAYYILRPVRDEMGVQAGAHQLPWLFGAVFLTMLAVVPFFGWVAGRLSIRRLLPTVYGFFILNLIGFFVALQVGVPLHKIAPIYFVWVSVFNLFVVSVFWSFMADIFTTLAARRLYGVISAGGSLGAITGPIITALAVRGVGVAYLLLISATLLFGAIGCILALLRWFHQQHGHNLGQQYLHTSTGPSSQPPSIWIGLIRIIQSPYLRAICLYLVCYSILSTFLYTQQTILVPQVIADSAERTQLFATLDFIINLLTVCIQFFVTGHVLRKWGVTVMLAAMPLVSLLGFGLFGLFTVLPVLMAFGVLRRAGEFSITKPTRESLFTVVPREEKYQAKNIIDTVVHRGGDWTGTWVGSGLHSLGLSLSQMAYAALPIASIWLITGVFLGRRHESIRKKQAETA